MPFRVIFILCSCHSAWNEVKGGCDLAEMSGGDVVPRERNEKTCPEILLSV